MKYGTLVKIINDPFFEAIQAKVIGYLETDVPAQNEDRNIMRYMVEFDGQKLWFSETQLEAIENQA